MGYDLNWLDSKGLCHKCGSRNKFPGRQFCPECLEKISENNAKKYSKEKAHEYQSRRREIYQEKKESGICVRCTKPATHGMYCIDHYIAQRKMSKDQAERQKRERHDRGLIPIQRAAAGTCLWCGAQQSGGTLACDRHREMFATAGRKGSARWKEINDLMYMESKSSGHG